MYMYTYKVSSSVDDRYFLIRSSKRIRARDDLK